MASVTRRRTRAVNVPLPQFEEALSALHSDSNRAAELGRKGGDRNRKVYDVDVPNVPTPTGWIMR